MPSETRRISSFWLPLGVRQTPTAESSSLLPENQTAPDSGTLLSTLRVIATRVKREGPRRDCTWDSKPVRRRPVDMLSEIAVVEIVGQAGKPDKAEAEIRRLSPDVVILDLKRPRRNGIALTSYRTCEYW
jgi:hypothetical protein